MNLNQKEVDKAACSVCRVERALEGLSSLLCITDELQSLDNHQIIGIGEILRLIQEEAARARGILEEGGSDEKADDGIE